MRKTLTVALVVLAAGSVLALGFAVAAFGSSTSTAAPADTTETTTTTTESTTETHPDLKYVAVLGRLAEVPKPARVSSRARGAFTITVTQAGDTYTAAWKLTFSKLTGKAVAAHIHRGAPGKAGPVLLALCGPCRSGQSGKAQVPATAVAFLNGGLTYVNVHTARNGAGEIRGRVRKLG